MKCKYSRFCFSYFFWSSISVDIAMFTFLFVFRTNDRSDGRRVSLDWESVSSNFSYSANWHWASNSPTFYLLSYTNYPLFFIIVSKFMFGRIIAEHSPAFYFLQNLSSSCWIWSHICHINLLYLYPCVILSLESHYHAFLPFPYLVWPIFIKENQGFIFAPSTTFIL